MVPAGAPAEDSGAPLSAPEKPKDGFVPPPEALVEPIQSLGIGASTTEQTNVGTVAVQGLFKALVGADSVAGYLGVNNPDTTTDDFVSPYLKALSDDEIGVLGFSANSSDDNFGVVGVGGESAWGGRFINSDAIGGCAIWSTLQAPMRPVIFGARTTPCRTSCWVPAVGSMGLSGPIRNPSTATS
jgi:hypothetical protein